MVPSVSALLAASLAQFSRSAPETCTFPGEDFVVPAGVDAWHRCDDGGNHTGNNYGESEAARVAAGGGPVNQCECDWAGEEGRPPVIASHRRASGMMESEEAIDFTNPASVLNLVGFEVGPAGESAATLAGPSALLDDGSLPEWVRSDTETCSMASLCAVFRGLGLGPEIESAAFSCANRVIDAAVKEACGSEFFDQGPMFSKR